MVSSLTAAVEEQPSHYTCDQVKRTIRPELVDDQSGVCADPQPHTGHIFSLPSWNTHCNLNDANFGRRCPAMLPATPLREPTRDDFDTPLGDRPRYGTCAVVGSGGSLLGSACGAEIDAHEMVVRTNAPRTDEPWSADVGSRTTLMAVNAMMSKGIAGLSDHGYWTHVHDEKDPGQNRPIDLRDKDMLAFAGNNEIWALVNHHKAIRDALGVRRIFAYTQEYAKAMDEWTRHFYHHEGVVSKGMLTVFIMLLMCDQLDVYGYSDELPGQPYHCTPQPHRPRSCDPLAVPCTVCGRLGRGRLARDRGPDGPPCLQPRA